MRGRIQEAGLEETAPILGKWDTGVLLLEMIWLALFLMALSKGGAGHRIAVQALTEGDLSQWFWMGVVIIGLVIPLFLGVLEPVLKEAGQVVWPLFTKLHLVLIGGLILRYVIVWGGDIKQPLNYPPQMWGSPKVSAPNSPHVLSQALRQIHRR